ncbi:DUF4124 domain-containing protein [Pseudomonas benzenivorans]|uniref:DUF4124 domain-containing protein n=1 Tax=Pseudomonas benzenivorans TaxID=556533 RepID=A0ABY5H4N8_9PSED|nr:DUF4124 domain-containing protein [Pseudomonas benzenivorans]UTW07258.1 DUF4124 domain-containing protein [Pseudomonas benzenivorans]
MHGLHCAALCATLLCPAPLLAATVFRCEDPSGHITFTLQGCSEQQTLKLQAANNPTPGSGKPVPLAKAGKTPRNKARTNRPEPVVVAEKRDGCGDRVTGSARRTAIIKEEILGGMTRADVESALGTPDKVSSQNGQTRYHYRDQQGNSRQISFDEAGCVKGKR